MSNSSKSDRKENRIHQLEKELSEQKKKNAELQKQKTIRLDDEQVEAILDSLTQCAKWSTNRIIDESQKPIVIQTDEKTHQDGFSFVIKWSIASFFFIVTLVIGYSLYSIWGEYWGMSWWHRIALFIIVIADFDCFLLGIEILLEKDRNYIISLFSALVALVALIVALIK